jgi:hypothetical protein
VKERSGPLSREDVEVIWNEGRAKLAICVYRLQKEAGLTFREARCSMIVYGEGGLALQEEYGMSNEAFWMARSRAARKIRRTGMTLEEFCGDDLPGMLISD